MNERQVRAVTGGVFHFGGLPTVVQVNSQTLRRLAGVIWISVLGLQAWWAKPIQRVPVQPLGIPIRTGGSPSRTKSNAGRLITAVVEEMIDGVAEGGQWHLEISCSPFCKLVN